MNLNLQYCMTRMTQRTIHIDSIKDSIQQKKWKALRHDISDFEPVEIARILEELPGEEDIILFRLLPKELAKSAFKNLSHKEQTKIVERLAQNAHKVAKLLNELDADDRTAFFEELPGEVVQQFIQLMDPEERKIASSLLGYPADSIGRLMTPKFVAIKPEYTVSDALHHIRQYGHDSATLNVIYVIDDQGQLIDELRMREIILAQPDQRIRALMDDRFVSLNAFDDQEDAIRVFKDHDRVALPVIDSEGILLGIVTFDDVMDVEEEEATEDFHKFGSVGNMIVNPLKARITDLYTNRVLWLTALVFMNVFSGAAISSFENLLESVVSLVFFLPLIIDSGGNAGAQSATLTIRSLAIGDVQTKDWLKLIGKEVMVSLLLGVTMAVGVGLIASFRAPEVITVVTLTMVLIVMTGSMVGIILPFVFTKLNIDPASASAPLITSISDISGVVLYFSIANWFFGL